MYPDDLSARMDTVLEKALDIRGLPGSFRAYSVCGGKRYRGRLLLDICGRDDDDAVKAACAVELVHAATLIHDDVIDRSGMRRGRPALHLISGVTAGVLYGDLLFSRAFDLLSGIRDQRIWKEMVSSVSLVIEGETGEQLRKGDVTVTEREYLSIVEKKTGELFGISCKAGAMLGGRDEAGALSAYDFGKALGTAYQIYDDCMDIIGEEDKNSFKDADNGIMTLPLIKYLAAAEGVERELFKESMGGAGGDKRRVVARVMIEDTLTPSLECARSYLRKAVREADKGLFGGGAIAPLVMSVIEGKIDHAQKKYSDIRRRLCGAKRP